MTRESRNHLAAVVVACVFSSPALTIVASPAQAESPKSVTLRAKDGGLVHGDLSGAGPRGVVLAHGGRFNKGSWEKQARQLVNAGFRVLAIDFRGYGQSTGPGQNDVFTAPLHLDVLAAVHYLRATGATTVSAIGGSLGGGAAANATMAEPGAIDRLVLLGATPDGPPDTLTVRKLYITTRDDASGAGPRLPGLQAHFDRAPEPKFQTDQAGRVMREILRFLAAP